MAKKMRREAPGNYVSEWFGHRVFPSVESSEASVRDQQDERCPFLSNVTGENRRCIKSEASKGVCTINSLSNGRREDWLVCPYRSFGPELIGSAVRTLFGLDSKANPQIVPAISLVHADTRMEISTRLAAGELVFIYFDAKLGGELSIPQTDRSPEFSFDVTIIELVNEAGVPHVGRLGFLEIQTMDFHGSYRAAVRNLREGLRMHGGKFGATLQEYQHWLSEGVEGPNIANVFKRTFYQMMFKFQLGKHDRCMGCVLAIPEAVWGSWQKHLGKPTLRPGTGGVLHLDGPQPETSASPAWIFVFDTVPQAGVTPSPIEITKIIQTSAASVGYWALEVAPTAALQNISSDAGLVRAVGRRLKAIWPELADTVTL